MYRKGLVEGPNFLEDEHLEAKLFYMPSLNGMVNKCPHGLFEVLFKDENSKSIRCQYCFAKLLPNETSHLCCANGKIKCQGKPWQMKWLKDPPNLIKDLFNKKIDPNFKNNIRKYNNALACASIGIDEEIFQKGFSPNIKIHGKIYHSHGSLIPKPGEKPNFAQIIVYDGNLEKEAMHLSQLKRRMEVSGRKKHKQDYEDTKAKFEVNEVTMSLLQEMLHEINSYYITYKALVEIKPELISHKVVVLQNEKPKNTTEHWKNYCLPTECEVAIVDVNQYVNRPVDIVIHVRGGGPPKRISERNRSFQPLHYVLLFSRGGMYKPCRQMFTSPFHT